MAIAGLDIAFCIECRLFRIDQHGAADSVTAEQRTLRPLEHLDIGEVEGRDIAPFLGQGHVVEIGDNGGTAFRSEEHKSELQSLMRLSYAVFCLKKKKTLYY